MTDTAQRRAEAQKFYYSLNAGCDGGLSGVKAQIRDEQEDISKICALIEQTRRAALEEASKLAREHSKRAAVAKYNVFKGEKFEFRAERIGNEIADALDRLREGVGK